MDAMSTVGKICLLSVKEFMSMRSKLTSTTVLHRVSEGIMLLTAGFFASVQAGGRVDTSLAGW